MTQETMMKSILNLMIEALIITLLTIFQALQQTGRIFYTTSKAISINMIKSNRPSQISQYIQSIKKATDQTERHIRRVIKSIAENDPGTKVVVLNNRAITEESMADLTLALTSNTHIRVLYLHSCGITARGAHLLAYTLKKNSSIQHLWLNGNKIGSHGALVIAYALQKSNRSLKTLGLGSNDIGNHGGKAIYKALMYNTVLTKLYLEGNRISEEILGKVFLRCDRRRNGIKSCDDHDAKTHRLLDYYYSEEDLRSSDRTRTSSSFNHIQSPYVKTMLSSMEADLSKNRQKKVTIRFLMEDGIVQKQP